MGIHAPNRILRTMLLTSLLALALPAAALAADSNEPLGASSSVAAHDSSSRVSESSAASSASSIASAGSYESAASANTKPSDEDGTEQAQQSETALSSTKLGALAAKKYPDGWNTIAGKLTYWKSGKQVKSAWISTATPAYPGVTGTQRYWLDANGTLAVNRFINTANATDKDAGFFAFATSTGAVATGAFTYNNQLYLATSKGKLATARGWVSTSAYTGNAKQRYYLVASKDNKNLSVAKTGFFKVGKYRYYGIPKLGYLARGTYQYSKSSTLLASKSKGILRTSKGWLKSKSYNADGKYHVYYLREFSSHKGYYAARTGLFKVRDGKKRYKYYAKPGVGHIVHGAYRYADGVVLLANPKNGHLYGKSGWLKTGKYDSKGKIRHYRMRSIPGHKGYYAARAGLFKVGSYRYYGKKYKGYLLKDSLVTVKSVRYRANHYYHVRPAEYLYGIDISSYQQDMNVTKVDADFVIIKATEGTGYVNPFWATMTKQALASGKQIGFYHYANPGTGKLLKDADAKKRANAEADFFLKTIGTQYLGKANLFLDFEGEALPQTNNYALYFMDRIKSKTGVAPMLYISKSYTRAPDGTPYPWNAIAKKYPLWVAQYANYLIMNHTTYPWTDGYGTGPWKGATIFQYTSTGRISGYKSNLDLDLFYGTSADWLDYAKVRK